jgi:deoxyribonuclease IV
MAKTVLLGSHMSTQGGVHTAFARGTSIGCTTMQIFVKNNNRWAARPQTDEDVRQYRSAAEGASIAPVVAHAAYLINLCSPNPDILERSRMAFADELRRCNALGVKALIVHPGAHMNAGEDEGIKRIADSINVIHAQTPGCRTLTTLESTAGQGSAVGYRFEHLRGIFDLVDDKSRMAVCLDTCHLFAAGYDISTERGWDDTMTSFGSIVGWARLVAFHVNDSKKGLGSRVDRHDHIGKGMIGVEGFASLMNDDRLASIPKILETEKSEDMHEDVENMTFLRSLIR